MKLGRILLFLVVALPMLLVGYQLVELEIIPHAAVELTPGAPTESEPEIQLVAPQVVALEDYNDDAALEVILAYPHVLFQPDQTTVMPFEQGTDATYYLVGDRDQWLRLRAQFDATWLDDTYGQGVIRTEVNVFPPNATDWEQWAYDESWLEGWGRYFYQDLHDTNLWFDQPGPYKMQITLFMNSYLEDGNAYEEARTNYEFELVNFSTPSEGAPDLTAFQPPFADTLAEQGIVLNWSAWDYGPCALHSDNGDVTPLLDQACAALENGDYGSLQERLFEALNVVTDEPMLQATLRDQIGLMALFDGQWNIAQRHFSEALQLWQQINHVHQAIATLHNLGVTLAFSDRHEEGESLLWKSMALASTTENWLATSLTWMQFAVFWDDSENRWNNIEQLRDSGFEQAEPLERWMETAEKSQDN